MSEFTLPPDAFPAFRRSVRAKWAPILMEPISGSMERFVIAVAVVSTSGYHLEKANALDRLECFYSDGADALVYAIEIALEHLSRDLALRSEGALLRPEPAVSGVVVGDCRDAEDVSLKAIGVNWMLSLSSLYNVENAARSQVPVNNVVALDERRGGAGDRLPKLVMEYIGLQRRSYLAYFSQDLRDGRIRRFRGRNHQAIIDFAGSKIVASFGTLSAGPQLGRSVDVIKRRLWDLKVHRDRHDDGPLSRHHEMLIQKPSANDPQFSRKQIENVSEALNELEAQADLESMRLVALTSVEAIGDRVIKAEAA